MYWTLRHFMNYSSSYLEGGSLGSISTKSAGLSEQLLTTV